MGWSSLPEHGLKNFTPLLPRSASFRVPMIPPSLFDTVLQAMSSYYYMLMIWSLQVTTLKVFRQLRNIFTLSSRWLTWGNWVIFWALKFISVLMIFLYHSLSMLPTLWICLILLIAKLSIHHWSRTANFMPMMESLLLIPPYIVSWWGCWRIWRLLDLILHMLCIRSLNSCLLPVRNIMQQSFGLFIIFARLCIVAYSSLLIRIILCMLIRMQIGQGMSMIENPQRATWCFLSHHLFLRRVRSRSLPPAPTLSLNIVPLQILQVIWLRRLLADFGYQQPHSTPIHCGCYPNCT